MVVRCNNVIDATHYGEEIAVICRSRSGGVVSVKRPNGDPISGEEARSMIAELCIDYDVDLLAYKCARIVDNLSGFGVGLEPTDDRNACVYVYKPSRGQYCGKVKVGYSEQPTNRLRALQKDDRYPDGGFVMQVWINKDHVMFLEMALHKRLVICGYGDSGSEWFEETGTVNEFHRLARQLQPQGSIT